MENKKVLEARNVTKEFPVPGSFLQRSYIAAVDQVSVAMHERPPSIPWQSIGRLNSSKRGSNWR